MRETLPQSDEERAETASWEHLYGPWDSFDLDGARSFFDGFDRPWWLVGGWAIEAFTGAPREHEDIDVSVLARDVPALRDFVGDRWHLWSIDDGRLRPLTDRWPDLPAPDCQVWVRRDASSPWVMDLPVTPDVDGRWQNKRDLEHVVDLDEATWVGDDGVRALNPEIVLLFKARLDRVKDRRDLDRALPLLDAAQRAWLRDRIARAHPGHGWLGLLGTDPTPRSSEVT
ncbi:MAG TPA: hypothetical protein VFJ89_14110 [Nocardioides sp.]|nr:hypothetical protein [Nocardioides sp.]